VKRTGGVFRLRQDFGARGRHLVLVDIENILGMQRVSTTAVSWARVTLRRLLVLGDLDLIVIGASHSGNAVAAGLAWPETRLVLKPGPNGADLGLLEAMAEDVPGRFTGLTLVSGDGIFTDAVAALAGCGVPTTVIARVGSLSKRLQLAATNITCISTPVWESSEGWVA